MRKVPRQQRSRAMVDAIVEAATRILGRRGWAAFTTNEVAQAAGVSVGSLYQYFPNKLALAEAIRQRHLQAVLAALSNAGDWSGSETLDLRVIRLIDGVVAAHSVDHALHRVLLDEVPLVSRENQDEFESEYQRRYRSVVAGGSASRDASQDEVAGRVLAAAVEGVVHTAARQGDLGSVALKNELCRLVRGYLRDRGTCRASDCERSRP
ncbi:TetR/AcrR family transcriptional regulator [Paraburkholderia lacunae]|uniref:TetR/AcrR family transcriptional regulator n=1 Tax=Paraburkholderia lacunae TaxID=2211104 RepID=A0A370NC34_9BURK|nr:TetR/AcrR family transcriptional regulator [Paraburkholderia lacunae]RDK03098.1 TetR/AcrR family transcriptional regulator [Paraburkholderia lacunae]